MSFHRVYGERDTIISRPGLPPPLPHSQNRIPQSMNSPVIVNHPHSPPFSSVEGAYHSQYGGHRDPSYGSQLQDRYAYHHGPPQSSNEGAYTHHHSSPKYNHHPREMNERLENGQRPPYYHRAEPREFGGDIHGRPYGYMENTGPGPNDMPHPYPIEDRGGYPMPQRNMPPQSWEHRRSVGMLPRSLGSNNGPPPPPNNYLSHPNRNGMHSIADPNMIHLGSPGDQRPTYVGYIKSAHDAILLLSACDLPSDSTSNRSPPGRSIPPPRRVTRRLLDAERADMVASGCIFAWDEKEAGMKRWTDGRVWSASRVSGCFLTYRELEARKKSNGATHEGPTSNQYKPEGLIKQSFSVTTASGRKLHAISYFTKRDVREGRLRRVSEDPRFVGEGGGEWGLKVNDDEYSFPDGTNRGVQPGQTDGQGDVDILDEDDDEDNLDSPMPFSIQQRPTMIPIDSGVEFNEKRREQQSMQDPFLSNSRKRSLPEDIDSIAPELRNERPRERPKLQRLRSSSYSGSPSGNASKPHSYQSGYSSSSVSTVPSSDPLETPPVISKSNNDNDNKPMNILPQLGQQQIQPSVIARSKSIRALISPTLPRESAIRGSAHEMQPTDSQDSANAVGALLSLAGGSKKSVGPSALGLSNTENNATTNGNGNISGLGLSGVKAGTPDRRESDRNALNMFSIRL